MINTFFARKTGMTGKYSDKGAHVGATVLSVMPMKVATLRTREKHGYNAVQLHIEISGKGAKEANREIRVEEEELANYEVGKEVAWTDMIATGDKVSVQGITKGHGFTGAVKRYGFKGGPRTHGQSDRERAPGSSGPTTTPGRVLKGKRRAGHMGVDTVTIKGLKVLEVDLEKKTVTVSGSVPGANNYTLLKIKKT